MSLQAYDESDKCWKFFYPGMEQIWGWESDPRTPEELLKQDTVYGKIPHICGCTYLYVKREHLRITPK